MSHTPTPNPGPVENIGGAFAVADRTKTYHGRPCKNCGETLRWRRCRHCVACRRKQQRTSYAADADRAETKRKQVREYMRDRRANDPGWVEQRRASARERYYDLDHIAYHALLLKNRRRRALKRMEARHGSL